MLRRPWSPRPGLVRRRWSTSPSGSRRQRVRSTTGSPAGKLVLAHVWLRAVRGAQLGFVAALNDDDVESAAEAAIHQLIGSDAHPPRRGDGPPALPQDAIWPNGGRTSWDRSSPT